MAMITVIWNFSIDSHASELCIKSFGVSLSPSRMYSCDELGCCGCLAIKLCLSNGAALCLSESRANDVEKRHCLMVFVSKTLRWFAKNIDVHHRALGREKKLLMPKLKPEAEHNPNSKRKNGRAHFKTFFFVVNHWLVYH